MNTNIFIRQTRQRDRQRTDYIHKKSKKNTTIKTQKCIWSGEWNGWIIIISCWLYGNSAACQCMIKYILQQQSVAATWRCAVQPGPTEKWLRKKTSFLGFKNFNSPRCRFIRFLVFGSNFIQVIFCDI